jgi:hypothetical protein
MNSFPYYIVRPGYGSKELLIEFGGTADGKSIVQSLIQLLTNNRFTINEVQDNFGSDEYCYQFTSSHGKITLSIDTWDFVFIHGDNNQEDIYVIDEILKNSNQFIKKEVDFEKYK